MSAEIILSVIAIILSIASGLFTWWTFVWTARRDRRWATLDAYNRLQEQALDHLNQYSPSSARKIAENTRSPEYKELSCYIARIEHFCVGVNGNIYDKNMIYELAHGYFDGGLRDRITPIIDRKNQCGYDYYSNIHAVYAWMDQKTSKCKKQ